MDDIHELLRDGNADELAHQLRLARKYLEQAFWMGHTEGRIFAGKDTGNLDKGITKEELERCQRRFDGWRRSLVAEEVVP